MGNVATFPALQLVGVNPKPLNQLNVEPIDKPSCGLLRLRLEKKKSKIFYCLLFSKYF